jgi:hypothetical protein
VQDNGREHWMVMQEHYLAEMVQAARAEGLLGTAHHLDPTDPHYYTALFTPKFPDTIMAAPAMDRVRTRDTQRHIMLLKFYMPDPVEPLRDFWAAVMFPQDRGAVNCRCNYNSPDNERYNDGLPIPNRSAYLKEFRHDSLECLMASTPHRLDMLTPLINVSHLSTKPSKNAKTAVPSLEIAAYLRDNRTVLNKLLGKPKDYLPPASERENPE